MSGKSLIDQIRHYQKDIERCPENSERMIRCIQRLYVLPILVQHLQETGVGRSVNSLRKYEGEVGDAAKALVAKWKAMVAAEESEGEQIPEDPQPTSENVAISSPPPSSSSEKNYKSIKEKERSHYNESSNYKRHEGNRHHNDHGKHKSANDHSKSSSSSNHHGKHTLSSNGDKHHRTSSKDCRRHKSSNEHSKHYASSNDRNKHHASSLSSSKISRNHESSKISEKDTEKRKHSSSAERYKKYKTDSENETSPNRKKRRKHSSSEINKKEKQHIKSTKDISDSESEQEILSQEDHSDEINSPDDELESSHSVEENVSEDNFGERDVNGSEEIEEQEEVEDIEEESDKSDESDHRHRSKHISSHKYKSSHSNKDKNKDDFSNHKESSSYHKKKERYSSSSKSTSEDLKKLVKENGKKVKKEKHTPEKSYQKASKVKIERNEDGSVDNNSGASFADALLGVGELPVAKKKKKLVTISKIEKHESVPSSSHVKRNSKDSPSSHQSSSSSKKSKSSTIKEIDVFKEPDLLSKDVKLDELDIDISSTLPEIDPNYKPLPHIPEHSLRRNNRTMTEEETMFSIMTTKNQRTKVYSGAKIGSCAYVPTLYSLCIKLLYENIEAVEYTGGVPYDLLKPLLEKLNADQLYVLEHYNAYLIDDTNGLWQFHCRKDFRGEVRKDMESWRDLYLRCMDEREKKLKELTANITQSMAKSTPVRTTKLAYVDNVAKPPRNIARKQAKFGTGHSKQSSSNPSTSSGINLNKQEIVSKAFVGANTPGMVVKDVVPPPPKESQSSFRPTPNFLKKKKAPLMAKALQLIKGNRFKR